ncbi:hypothetical protein [Parageobacillus thermoglucosidasius]|uniref:hypothetical protein n=1 Tax=Parageobacillus thermoglucosidasius TaxID=1426 RepID=UPI000E1B51F5|nr:hypothetical protein [Parageobacillus thermoglucosidasius]RDE19247.1 hypothetical protein DV714_19520 [Parageobacillus thermoglucosidasius]
MKKIVMTAFVLLLIAGCSSKASTEKTETNNTDSFPISLEEFVNEYNKNLDTLKDNNFEVIPSYLDLKSAGEFKKEKNGSYVRELIREPDNTPGQGYSIDAWYNKDKKLKGLALSTLSINDQFSQKGIVSATVMLKSLGLDGKQLSNFLDGDKNEVEYTEGKYRVSFMMVPDMGVLLVHVEKKKDLSK